MPTLRLAHSLDAPDQHRVEVRLEGDGRAPIMVTCRFAFALSDQDREDIRWYLENYALFPADPAIAVVAARIERRMEQLGAELFRAIFHSSDDARALWAELRFSLNQTRVEVTIQ